MSDDFEIRKNSNADEIEFIRRFKMYGMGYKRELPPKLTSERVVVVSHKTAAKLLGVRKDRFRKIEYCNGAQCKAG